MFNIAEKSLENTSDINKYVQLLNLGSLDTYKSENSEKDRMYIQSRLDSNFSNCNIFLIKSDVGNGGTHLLSGIANKLLISNKKIACIGSHELLQLKGVSIGDFENYLNSTEYCLIDNFNTFLRFGIYRFYEVQELIKILKNYLKSGKKIILQCCLDTNNEEIKSILGDFILDEVTSVFPPLHILEEIGMLYYDYSLVKAYSSEIYNNGDCTCVRAYLCLLTCHYAKLQLELLNISKENNK